MVGRQSMRIGCRAAALLLAACLPIAPLPAAHLHPIMAQEQLANRMGGAQSPPMIDVRTPEEFRAGHLPGAINIPLQDFPRRLPELSAYRDREVVLYCETGSRAKYGGHWLKSMGFQELRFLDGHMIAWRRAGLPTER